MSGEIYSIIYTSTPLVLMISMSFFCWTRVCMDDFGMSTIAKYLCSCEFMIHVSSTDYVETVGELESYLEIK